MRRPTARIFRNTVTLITFTPSADAAGGNVRTPSAGTAFACSVQPAAVARRVAQGALQAETTHVVFFRAYPADTSAGARVATPTQRLGPEVNTQDLLAWSPPGPAAPVPLAALGRAMDQGGAGVCWAVECKEVV